MAEEIITPVDSSLSSYKHYSKKQADGSWRTVVTISESVRREFKGKTKAEAEEKAKAHIEQL